ncbi:MAG TPA: hypothetical protein VG758_00670 [Hyphomicrobiaceae bacterium]|jgi:hypothetical protein|nr:hypothetical protein [Hyphomicrobiaceae bacterium]
MAMRWFHEGVDRLYIGVMRRLLPPIFRHGCTSPSLQEHLAAVELTMPALDIRRRHVVAARTSVGDVQAGFRVRLGARPELPLLIFHHGLGEIPHDHTFRGIFPRRMPIDAHLAVVQAPFHRSHIECLRGVATLSRLLATCAVSVALIEALRLAFAARGAQGTLVAGISFGGFVTLLHHLSHGTATRYAPLMAGPDFAHAFLSTPCGGLLSPQARAHPADLQARLDFRQAFRASDTRRILPLLGRYDLWMPCAHQLAEYAASGVPVTLIDRGHMTSSWAFAKLRAHLRSCLARVSEDAMSASPGGRP